MRQSCSDKCLRVGYKLYPLLFVYELRGHFPASRGLSRRERPLLAGKEAIQITRHLNWDNRKVYFLVIGYWKCAAGWGRIFKTWIDYNVVPFSIVKNIPPPPPSPLFRIIGVTKFLKMGECAVKD